MAEDVADTERRHIRPRHPLVSHVPLPPLAEGDLDGLPTQGDAAAARRALAELCLVDEGNYVPTR